MDKIAENTANTSRICLEAFKFYDMNHFIWGEGKEKTGFTLKEWAFGQSPLATIIGLCCIVLRFLDTRLAALVGEVNNVRLRAYQKVTFTDKFNF